MPRNGSGTYTLPQPSFVAGTVISSAAVNSDLSDIATALTGSLPRDGQAGMIGQLKLPDGSAPAPSMAFTTDSTTGFFHSGSNIGIAIGGLQVAIFSSAGLLGQNPIGVILDYGGGSAPATWLLCFGQAISRTTYSLLFTAIGTTFGSGDGVTTFNVPDLRGNATYGKDNMGGSAAGRLTTAFFGTDPTVLGNRGGSQNSQLGTSNLPPYTPTGAIPITDPGHFHTYFGNSGSTTTGGGAFPAGASSSLINTGTASTGITASFTGGAQGGTAVAFANVSPGSILNKIIFAGV